MGDRLVGRRNALVFSIVLITVPSVLMGMLPTYDMWGVAAPICLVILRMLQGLSVGGQLAGSFVISIEQSSVSNRGFRGSVCEASSVSYIYNWSGSFSCNLVILTTLNFHHFIRSEDSCLHLLSRQLYGNYWAKILWLRGVGVFLRSQAPPRGSIFCTFRRLF